MLYITRHSKARKTTNQEFQVARYLPAKDSVALAIYLIYIRPLTDMIHRSCFGTNKDRKYLFSSVDDPDKHWKPSRLTAVLRRLTKEVASIEIGVQVYRQLSIAVTERHLAYISKPFNHFDDKTVDANVDVALAWQSGHRPMQRGTSYGIDAAYPDFLQPALLRVYRWTSDIWHRFLDETQDTNGNRAISPTTTDNGHAERPRKRQRTNHGMSYPRTPAPNHISLQYTPEDIDMAAQMAHDDIEQRSVRSNTQCSHGVEGCQLSEEDIPGDSTTVSTSTLPMPTQSRVRSSGSIGRAPPSTLLTRPHASSNEQAPTHRLFGSSKKTFATDQEVRAAASLTDVDVFRQFEYLEDFKLLVCKIHGYAVRNVKRHLEEQHQGTKAVNRAAAARLASLEIHDPRVVNLPVGPIPPFTSLSPPISGFLCGGEDGNCDFLSTSTQILSRHWKNIHGLSKGRERLRYQKEVELQSFTHMRSHSARFIVDSRLTSHSRL
jgi:hypothetical protein